MKKISMTIFAALLGGVMALGGYKLLESKQDQTTFFEERQAAHFANDPKLPPATVGTAAFAQAASDVTPAVVHIKTTYAQKPGRTEMDPSDLFEQFFGVPRGQGQPRQQAPAMASGSGVIIKDDGYIVTNNHVVENADKIEVVLPDKRSFEAKIIGRDPNTDLALIKIGATSLPVVPMGNSDAVQIGEWVLAVGYPLSLESTVTAGIVSAKGRRLGILDQTRDEQGGRGYGPQQPDPDKKLVSTAIESFIQTDAVINQGNSGGALVNTNGELIGINSALASPSGYYAGYGFAVPTNLVKKIVEDFVKFGRVNRGMIGVTFRELSPEGAKELGIADINGLYIDEVVPGGAAEKAGLKKGDILTGMDGTTINASSDLQERVYRLRPGDQVKLTYKRGGKLRDATVTLMEDKAVANGTKKTEEAAKSATMIYNDLGAGFVPASPAQKKKLGVTSGMIVTRVNPDGLFDYYNVPEGLLITEVNGRVVNNVDDVEVALGNTERGMVRLKGYSPQGEVIEMRFPVNK